jgi:hypothetical protein
MRTRWRLVASSVLREAVVLMIAGGARRLDRCVRVARSALVRATLGGAIGLPFLILCGVTSGFAHQMPSRGSVAGASGRGEISSADDTRVKSALVRGAEYLRGNGTPQTYLASTAQ